MFRRISKDLLLIDSWVLKCKEFITKYGDIPFLLR